MDNHSESDVRITFAEYFVTGDPDEGDETSSVVTETAFTIALAVIISGLIICIGYWLVRL